MLRFIAQAGVELSADELAIWEPDLQKFRVKACAELLALDGLFSQSYCLTLASCASCFFTLARCSCAAAGKAGWECTEEFFDQNHSPDAILDCEGLCIGKLEGGRHRGDADNEDKTSDNAATTVSGIAPGNSMLLYAGVAVVAAAAAALLMRRK